MSLHIDLKVIFMILLRGDGQRLQMHYPKDIFFFASRPTHMINPFKQLWDDEP